MGLSEPRFSGSSVVVVVVCHVAEFVCVNGRVAACGSAVLQSADEPTKQKLALIINWSVVSLGSL